MKGTDIVGKETKSLYVCEVGWELGSEIMIEEGRAKTQAEAYEALIDAVRNLIVTVLREVRKPVLKLCKFIDILIEAFSERRK